LILAQQAGAAGRKIPVSLPRQIVPGRVYMITRRCTQRAFLLHPDADTTNAFLYCLGYASQRTGVGVLFFLAMSNHYHAGIIDRTGRLPEFLETFHKLFAKHQNTLRGRWENFWATEQTSAVELVGSTDVLSKMVYALTNPVKDHLVERADQWPGATSVHANIDQRTIVASRPWRFFRKDGSMPDAVALTIDRPPGLEDVSPNEFRVLLQAEIGRVELKAAEERRSNGTRVLGRALIRRQDWRDRPKTLEPRRQLDPRVACKNLWRRVETLARNKAWLEAYRSARDAWAAGEKVTFPPGTYWLRRFVGVPCEPTPRCA
jgi:putative transposase